MIRLALRVDATVNGKPRASGDDPAVVKQISAIPE